MSDWLTKIVSLISQSDIAHESPPASYVPELSAQLQHKLKDLPQSLSASPTPPTERHHYALQEKESNMAARDHSDENENIKALKRLRELPRGTQVESRIAAVENLLGEIEIFKTLKMLRWPQGVICPRCQSTHVVRKEPPPDTTDSRHYYVCINCKKDGSNGEFDDFTGLSIQTLQALRQWMLCWYLIGFCSVSQIAKVLGISIQQVVQMAAKGAELAELPADVELKSSLSEKARDTHKRHRQSIEQQEESTRSESKSPLKPGYKSKK